MSDLPDLVQNLKRKLRVQMNDLADNLAGGNCASFDEYKWKTGVIYGLATAERILLDWQEKVIKDTTGDGAD